MSKLRTFHTTESLTALLGISGTLARTRIKSGEWKPSAQTSSGKALFSDAAAAHIAARELKRTDGRTARRTRATAAHVPAAESVE